ncbi:hypothetical protein ACVWZR_006520 [Bradyrhizobium sp. i1.3.1]
MVVAMWLASLSGTEVDEEYAPAEIRRSAMPDGDGDGGLADAAGADHRHEAMQRKPVRYLLDDLLPSDHFRERRGKGTGRCNVHGGLSGRRSRVSERGDKAVAAAGHIDDITGRLAGIAQRLAQCRDVEAQAALVDIDVGPDALDQLSLVDDFAGALGEEDQNIERAAADVKRRALLLQEPRLRK